MVKAPMRRRNGPRFKRPDHKLTTTERGYDQRWKDYRLWFLGKMAIDGRFSCVMCGVDLARIPESKIHVDHIRPHQGQRDPLFWDESNHQLLCQRCHSKKTAREGGGFGDGATRAAR